MTANSLTFLAGHDAIDLLVQIYMDGVTTGAGSALATFSARGLSDAEVDAMADVVADGMRNDAEMMLVVRNEVQEILTGHHTGPKNFHLPAPGDES